MNIIKHFYITFKILIVDAKFLILNSNDVGTGLYRVICKKFRMSLLHDHLGHMVIFGPFQRQFRNNYFIFKPNLFFIPIPFPINFHNNYLSPFLITTSIL